MLIHVVVTEYIGQWNKFKETDLQIAIQNFFRMSNVLKIQQRNRALFNLIPRDYFLLFIGQTDSLRHISSGKGTLGTNLKVVVSLEKLFSL